LCCGGAAAIRAAKTIIREREELPMKPAFPLLAAALLFGATAGHAQMRALNDPVVAHPDPESLFTSPDPQLHRNKQVALKIVKELLEANHWDRAPLYLTERYIQHNPVAASGLAPVMHYFINVAKRTPAPIPEKMKTRVVAVQAEGDFVTVSFVRDVPYADDPAKSYTTTWFDMWRFVDGKADEHWDPATLPPAPPPAAAPAR
jgi:predicted SnoaL-like aldol condensation-catalyzing enzyme